jgi:hypothetical protein
MGLYEFTVFSTSDVMVPCYQGEAAGGWYELWEVVSEDEMYARYFFKEFQDEGGVISIFQVEGELVAGVFQSGAVILKPGEVVISPAGTKEGQWVHLNLSYLNIVWSETWKLHCFWPIEKQGMLPVGVELASQDLDSDYSPGFRDLQKVMGRTGGIAFEKYG